MHRLRCMAVVHLCSMLFVRLHNPDGQLAVYLPVKIMRALQLDCGAGFGKVLPLPEGKLWTGIAT